MTAACGSGDDGDDTTDGITVEPGAQFFPQSVASGDPRPSSVVVWTRVESTDPTTELRLQVARDESFTELVALNGVPELTLVASSDHDHCIKARLTDLSPGQTYYYRFLFERDGVVYGSQTGRTRTAPAPDADVPISFAVVSCQDYAGKYYHVYRHMAEQSLDFFVHLGDYIYETVGESGFQEGTEARNVSFSDTASALVIDPGTATEHLAAASLDNYRELYKVFRGDPDLQRAHERHPMIAVWDDHEYSNDAYGETATYTADRQDERDPERRANADQAWFEYMPVDFGTEELDFDRSGFPDNLKIYRQFEFGQHVHLVMTDERRYRPDHLVAEGAFPGAIAVTEPELLELLGSVPDYATAYVDLDTFDGGSYGAALEAAAPQTDFAPADFAGPVSVSFINDLITELGLNLEVIDASGSLPQGIAFHQMMKTRANSSIGSRSLLSKQHFEAYARLRYDRTQGQSENMLGVQQRQWFLDTLRSSTKTWKVWGNEVTFMPLVVDLRAIDTLPDNFRNLFYLSADDWGGFPTERQALLEEVGDIENLVAVTGDIHAFFVGSPRAASDPSKGIVEFVCSSVSSATQKTLLFNAATSDPDLAAVGAGGLALGVGGFLTSPDTKPNPHLAHQAFDKNGYGIAQVTGDTFEVTLYELTEDQIRMTAEQLGPVDNAVVLRRFRAETGKKDIYREAEGQWQRWDPETFDWV